jgi:hypothetical protein
MGVGVVLYGTTCCAEGGFIRDRFAVGHCFRKRDVEFLDLRIPRRDLGINDWIDHEAIAVGGTFDSLSLSRILCEGSVSLGPSTRR